jgi:hypothetical protein
MIILDATNKSITALTDVAATTTEPDYVITYTDHTTTTLTPGASDGALTGTTPVTIVASPASSTQRQVKYISITNRDTIAHQITVRYVNNASTRQMIQVVLTPNDVLVYIDKKGFKVLDSSGAERSSASVLTPSNYLASVFNTANLTSVWITVSNSSYAVYLGTCSKVSNSVSVRLRVTTAAATITWCEMAIFKGQVNIGGNPTLTRLGYADTSGDYNTNALVSKTITLSTNTAIGDELWAVFGAQATTALRVRAGLADDLQSGTYASLASTRPSTVTSPTAWTLAGATDEVPWIKAYVI